MKRVKKGMSLLEIVIALAIIGILLLPMMNSLLVAVKGNMKAEKAQDAKLIGQQVVEKLKIEDSIQKKHISFGSSNIEILDLNSSDPNVEYYSLKVTNINGYDIDGEIYRKDVSSVNGNSNTQKFIEEELGALLVIDKDEIYYSDVNQSGKNITEIIGAGDNFIKRTTGIFDDIKINFKSSNVGATKEYQIILDDNTNLSNHNNGILNLGIYVVNKNNFNFKFINETNENINVFVFRDSNLSKEEGNLNGDVSTDGGIKLYSNIIFDSEGADKGLYSVKLDVKKDAEIIESIQMEFYIGE